MMMSVFLLGYSASSKPSEGFGKRRESNVVGAAAVSPHTSPGSSLRPDGKSPGSSFRGGNRPSFETSSPALRQASPPPPEQEDSFNKSLQSDPRLLPPALGSWPPLQPGRDAEIIKELQQENASLKQQLVVLTQLQSQLEQLKKELAGKLDVEAEKNQAVQKLTELQKKIEALQFDNIQIARKLRELEAAKQIPSTEPIAVVPSQYADQAQEIDRLKKELEVARQKIKETEETPKKVPSLDFQAMKPASPAAVTKELEELRQQNQILNKTVDELMEQLQELQLDDAYSARVSEIMQTARSARPSEYVDVNALQREIETLRGENTRHLEARKEDTAKIIRLEAEVHLLRTPGVVPKNQQKVSSGKGGCCSS